MAGLSLSLIVVVGLPMKKYSEIQEKEDKVRDKKWQKDRMQMYRNRI